MKRIYTYFILLCAILITSCEGEIIDQYSLDRSIKVNANIINPTTRASNSSWSSGDFIGIYMKNANQELSDKSALEKNAKYTTNGDNKFKPASTASDIKFPADGERVDFIAYYPHSTISNTLHYTIDVSNQDSQEEIDLMYSDNAIGLNRNSNNVDLQFSHQLSKIMVDIKTKDGAPLKDVTASIKGINTKGKFSLIDKSISSSTKGNIKMKVNSKGDIAEAILIPTDNLAGVTLEITHGKFAYVYELNSSSKIKSFDSGYKYSYTMTLDPNSNNVSVVINPSSSINNWTEGPSENATLGKDSEIEETSGNGTKESPYSIDDARNKSGEKAVWVKGYIVGYYVGNTTKTFSRDLYDIDEVKTTSFALATSKGETDGNKTFPVALKLGKVRDALNLSDNPNNLDKEVVIKGNIDSYYGAIGFKESSDFELIN